MSISISSLSSSLYTQATTSTLSTTSTEETEESSVLSGASMDRRPPPPPSGGAPSHEDAINTLGSSLSEDVRESLLSTVEEMEEDGASFDEIRAYVQDELEANGVEMQRPGAIVNTVA